MEIGEDDYNKQLIKFWIETVIMIIILLSVFFVAVFWDYILVFLLNLKGV